METMDRLTPYCDFVFTGGEPLANLESLQQMLDKVSLTHKVYINTTLPVSQTQTEEEILTFLERNKQKITCLNISRHMQHFVQESNDSLLEKLPVRFRINCVLYKNYPKEQLVPFMERTGSFSRRESLDSWTKCCIWREMLPQGPCAEHPVPFRLYGNNAGKPL